MSSVVRDRGREILRGELAQAAADYCAEHGFTAVTVDDMARAVGVSRATFFRYFGSKEEAVVVAARAERDTLVDRLRVMQTPAGTSGLDAVRAALEPTVDGARASSAGIRARIRMIVSEPSLRARMAFDRAEQQRTLEQVMRERLADDATAAYLAAAAMAAIDVAWRRWAAVEESDLGAEFDRAFQIVGRSASVVLQAPQS